MIYTDLRAHREFKIEIYHYSRPLNILLYMILPEQLYNIDTFLKINIASSPVADTEGSHYNQQMNEPLAKGTRGILQSPLLTPSPICRPRVIMHSKLL